MDFKLTAAKRFYDSDDPEMERLEQLGCTFKPPDTRFNQWYLAEPGKVNFGSLEDFVEFCKSWECSVIFDPEMLEITIYNGLYE